jgi:hypothetical protein
VTRRQVIVAVIIVIGWTIVFIGFFDPSMTPLGPFKV